MARANPLLSRFNAGELSPLLLGRSDLDAYGGGCRLLENCLALPQGGVERRPGTRLIADLGAGAAFLHPFVAGGDDGAYLLAFSDGLLRVWTASAESGASSPVATLATPWPLSSLEGADGCFALKSVQSADVMWLCHRRHKTHILKRTGLTSFALEAFAPDGGPFADLNPDPEVTLGLTHAFAYIYELKASHDVFYPELDELTIRLRSANPAAVTPWEPGKAVVVDDLRRVDGRVYRATVAGSTGSIRPTHEKGEGSDGKVVWAFKHAGQGLVRVTSFQDARSLLCEVVEPVPDEVYTSAGDHRPTSLWELPAWDDRRGWPESCAFFRERLVLGRGRDLFFSRTDDFWNFSDNTGGETLADDAINLTIAQDRVEDARWLAAAGQRLVVGTGGGVLACKEASTNEPFKPGNVKVEPQTDDACGGAAPVRYGTRIGFLPRGGRRLKELGYSLDEDAIKAADLSVLAEHLGRPPFRALAWQGEPDSILWLVRGDGRLLSCARDLEQGVTGWARHPMSGLVESVAVLPSEDGDRLWLVVARAGRRRLLCMDPRDATKPRLDEYVDAVGSGTARIEGLAHLEGLTVGVAALEGAGEERRLAAQAPRAVDDGAIDLDRPLAGSGQNGLQGAFLAPRAYAGLPYRSLLETMPIEAGGQLGTVQGRPSRIHALTARLLEGSASITVGVEGDMVPLMKSPATGATTGEGDHRVAFPGAIAGRMAVRALDDGPLPFTLLALLPELLAHG